jgi:glycosyltransferase involved in cell wall biosynthesis
VKPRLLFLCQTFPYPPDGGVWIRTYHVLRLLARAFDITALCFERTVTADGGMQHDVTDGLRALGRFAEVEAFPVPQRHSRRRYLWDHARSAVLRRAYTTYLYESASFRRRLTDLLRSQRFDLVHLDSLDLAGYLPACRDVPVVCVHHNVESELLARRAAIERSAWRGAYVRYQARLTRDLERRWCGQIALNVAVSEEDRGALMRLAPGSSVTIVPNGVDVDEFQPDGPAGTGLSFVGGINWFPNLDALNFFCEEILPHIRAGGVAVDARWVGNASREQQRYYGDRYGVDVTGYVADARPHMRAAACHVVPLRAGGGTRLKILNAWAMGKAVVSTAVGCEGLAAIDGENILIRDDPRDFAKAVLAVLGNDELRRRLGERGRTTAEQRYSWEVIGRGLVESYCSIAARGRREVALSTSMVAAEGH